MKKLIPVVIFSIVAILSSCRSEKKNEMRTDIVTLEDSELIGHWVQSNKIGDSDNSKDEIVSKIHFKDDFTAEIEVVDSIGHETVPGNWEINVEQTLGPVSFQSDVILTFNRNENYKQIMSLSVKELNKKKILTADRLQFEKE